MRCILTIKKVMGITSISRSGLKRKEDEGTFPKKIPLGGKGPKCRKGYYDTDIEEWLKDPTGYRCSP